MCKGLHSQLTIEGGHHLIGAVTGKVRVVLMLTCTCEDLINTASVTLSVGSIIFSICLQPFNAQSHRRIFRHGMLYVFIVLFHDCIN